LVNERKNLDKLIFTIINDDSCLALQTFILNCFIMTFIVTTTMSCRIPTFTRVEVLKKTAREEIETDRDV